MSRRCYNPSLMALDFLGLTRTHPQAGVPPWAGGPGGASRASSPIEARSVGKSTLARILAEASTPRRVYDWRRQSASLRAILYNEKSRGLRPSRANVLSLLLERQKRSAKPSLRIPPRRFSPISALEKTASRQSQSRDEELNSTNAITTFAAIFTAPRFFVIFSIGGRQAGNALALASPKSRSRESHISPDYVEESSPHSNIFFFATSFRLTRDKPPTSTSSNARRPPATPPPPQEPVKGDPVFLPSGARR